MLQVESIKKLFGGATAIDDASFMVERGCIAALIGPNGAGKSTTFRIIAGLTLPDAGRVLWHGQTIQSALPKEQIGFLPEERGLYQDVSVEQLLKYWARLRVIRTLEIQDLLEQWLHRLDLYSRRSEKVRSLSKGNQQKLQLAACLMHRPHLLVLDEPFSGLDPINQDFISDILVEYADAGAAILISAHQLALVERIASNITLIQSGRTSTISGFEGACFENTAPSIRSVTLRIKRGAAPSFGSLPPYSVTAQEQNRLTIEFPAMTLSAFTSALVEVSSHDAVLDIEFTRPDLHHAYVSAITSNRSGVQDGP